MTHSLFLNLLRYRYQLLAILLFLVSMQLLTSAIDQQIAVSPLSEGSTTSIASTETADLASEPTTTVNYGAMADRPLFSRSRRPYVPPPPEPAQIDVVETQVILPEPQLTLQGIFISGSVRRALIATPDSPAATWHNEGDSISSWRLAEIKPNTLILLAGDQRRTVELYVEKPQLNGN